MVIGYTSKVFVQKQKSKVCSASVTGIWNRKEDLTTYIKMFAFNVSQIWLMEYEI